MVLTKSKVFIGICALQTTLLAGTVEAQPRVRINERPLRGLVGYAVLAVPIGPPQYAKRIGLDANAVRADVETTLKDAGLISSERSNRVGGIWVRVTLLHASAERYAWHAVLEVREPARLERDPDAGVVVAVSWDRAAYGWGGTDTVAAGVREAVHGLTEALIQAHARGGPATR